MKCQVKFLSTLSLRRATVDGSGSVATSKISIHALLAESDTKRATKDQTKTKFLSTLSLRRATVNTSFALSALGDFYPRSPCGERHPKMSDRPHNTNFYPRSPCGERLPKLIGKEKRKNFYPRSPCGERHFRCSIKCAICNFYPRSPCGERQTS